MASISDFTTAFKGGTRVNRFLVKSTGAPIIGTADHEILIRATTLPEMAIVPVPINFRGKTVQIPSTRVFTPWTFTVMDDAVDVKGVQKGSLHQKFIQWSDSIVDTGEQLGVSLLKTAIGIGGVGCMWEIQHLDHQTNEKPTPGNQEDANNTTATDHPLLKSFKLKNCWPIQVGPLQLDMGVDNQLSMFNVTLAYTHFES